MKKIEEKVFYHIYPLGFTGAPEYNDYNIVPEERLKKIIEWIPHMKYLGINALYLGPLFESKKHGYDTTDYFQVDRRLGTNETLKYVISKLHDADIKVVLDGVFNHVGRDFFAFKDLQKNKQESQYKDWFKGVNFSHNNPCNDNFTYDTWDGHYELVKLNLKNKDVSNHLINAAEYWINEFDIDGIRLDAADVLDFDFMKKLSWKTKIIKEDFWLLGEIVHGNYRSWIDEANLDSTTNYECYKGLFSSHNDKNYFEIEHSMKRLFGEGGIYKDLNLYNFADNHDVNRVASRINEEKHLFPLYILLINMPGIPSIYYGSEWGIEGEKRDGKDDEIRPDLNVDYMNSNFKDNISSHISKLIRIRKELKSLKYGDYKTAFVKPQQLGFYRKFEDEKTLILVNSSDKKVKISDSNIINGKYYDMLNDKEIYIDLQGINLNSNWGRVLKKI
ncbi:MAG: alpha-amylase family glycosyl hydrolase [Fusobacteriota bacterium]